MRIAVDPLSGAGDADLFKRGNAATITIVPALAPDQPVELSLSLSGFTAGFDSQSAVADQ